MPNSSTSVAICLTGQLRTASSYDLVLHWQQQARFVRSLMGELAWEGLHVFAAFVGSSTEIEATYAALAEWGLPPENVHVVPDRGLLPAALVRSACGEAASLDKVAEFCTRLVNASDYKRARLARQKFCQQTFLTNLLRYYAQWDTTTTCCRHVKAVEQRRGRRFDWLVKMRPDWPFERTSTPISAMERIDPIVYESAGVPVGRRRSVHARLRCTPQHDMADHFLATSTHNPWSINSGCGKNTTVIDDSFVVVRRAAWAAVCSAALLPCPLTDDDTTARALEWCHPKQSMMAECLLTVAAMRAGVRDFRPMGIRWSPHPPCPARVAAEKNRSKSFDVSVCKWSPHLLRSRQGNRSQWNWEWPQAALHSAPSLPPPGTAA